MATKTDFTAAEWEQLLEAPVKAGLYISLASPSITGSIGESLAVAKTIAETAQAGAGNPLLAAMLADFQNRETAQLAKPEFNTRKPDELKRSILESLSATAAMLNQKTTADEAHGVQAWLYQVASNVASASKEGGFLGIGGVKVSDAEKAALHELAGIFGVAAA